MPPSGRLHVLPSGSAHLLVRRRVAVQGRRLLVERREIGTGRARSGIRHMARAMATVHTADMLGGRAHPDRAHVHMGGTFDRLLGVSLRWQAKRCDCPRRRMGTSTHRPRRSSSPASCRGNLRAEISSGHGGGARSRRDPTTAYAGLLAPPPSSLADTGPPRPSSSRMVASRGNAAAGPRPPLRPWSPFAGYPPVSWNHSRKRSRSFSGCSSAIQ